MTDSQMSIHTQDIMLTAINKFGAIVGVLHNEKDGWILLIKRDNPARDDKPYMTIRAAMIARMHSNAPVPTFFSGNYNLSYDEALTDFAYRRA